MKKWQPAGLDTGLSDDPVCPAVVVSHPRHIFVRLCSRFHPTAGTGAPEQDTSFRIATAALILSLFAAPLAAAEPTPAFPSHTAQQIADVASYGTLGAGLVLETWDAFHCPNVGNCIWQELFGLTVAWAGSGILKTVVHRERPCAPACGIDSPNSSFPSGHAWFAGQTVWGEHKKLKAGLALATSGLRVAANKHHVSDSAAGFALGWSTTFVW